MTVLEAVNKTPERYLPSDNKFTVNLKKALLERKDKEYSFELFSEVFDECIKITECQNDNNLGQGMFNQKMYCKKCLEDILTNAQDE